MINQRSNEGTMLGIALAGIITIMTADGPYTLLNIVVSLTLLICLHAYHDLEDDDTILKRLAFGATWALSSISMIGFILQLISYEDNSTLVLSLYWLIVTVIVFLWRHIYYLDNHKKQNQTS
ncbi:MAG: hypothetical protein GC192_11670 [Bacteroidetes bacterium]|nr:hypothetical protein [Bacteroidota bacterium]